MDMTYATLSSKYQHFSYVPARLKKDYPDLFSRTNLTFG